MRAAQPFFLASLIAFSFNTASATTFYRHLPFSLTMSSHDRVVVDYDFSIKRGIHCEASQPINIQFEYKGEVKRAELPAQLMSDHIPTNATEHLADVSGQFTLLGEQNQVLDDEIDVSCNFI